MYNRRLSERLRYSVGGTYRLYGPRQMPESMISEAHASFVSCSQVFFTCGSYFQNKVQRSFFSIATMKQEIPYSSAQLLYYAWQLSRNRGGAE